MIGPIWVICGLIALYMRFKILPNEPYPFSAFLFYMMLGPIALVAHILLKDDDESSDI